MMKYREFKNIYHPGMGQYVCKQSGNGLIVDNLVKPLKTVASTVTEEVIKPTVSNARERVRKKVADHADMVDKITEKSSNLIRKHLSQSTPKIQRKRQTKGTAKKSVFASECFSEWGPVPVGVP